MLRISAIESDEGVTLRLEGKLLANWVSELLRAASAVPPERLRLDLKDVSFVDADGAVALRSLLARGAKLEACSSFVAQLLEGPSHA